MSKNLFLYGLICSFCFVNAAPSLVASSSSSGSIATAAGVNPAKRTRCDRPHTDDRESYAKATTDTAFKHLFDPGQAESRELLIKFLNIFVPDFRGNPVVELESLPVAVPPLPEAGHKQTFMDLHAKAKNGTHYILEMQARRHAMFDERALFYAAAVYSRQISESQFKDKDWYYHLKPVIALQILGYETNIVRGITSAGEAVAAEDKAFVDRVRAHPMKQDQFMKHFLFTEQCSGQVIDYLQILQFELPLAAKIKGIASKDSKERDSKDWGKDFSPQDWWIEILLNADSYNGDKVEELKERMPDEIYTALTRLDLRKWNAEMIKEYKEDLSDLAKYKTMIEAEKAGARQEGIAEGMEKGRLKTILEAIPNARDDRVSDEVLSKLLKLNEKEKLLLALDTDSIKAKLKALEKTEIVSEAGAAAGSAGS